MRLERRFAVPLPPAQAWSTLLDPGLVADCLPGAQLESIDGDVFDGRVRVRLGSVSYTYRGQGEIVSRNDTARRVVVELRGRDIRRASTAAAVVTAVVSGNGSGSEVRVSTALTFTGAPAEIPDGALAELSSRLVEQFATRLRAEARGLPINAASGDAGRPLTSSPAMGRSALAGLIVGTVVGTVAGLVLSRLTRRSTSGSSV